ncbi:hypothetical protein CHGG_04602 [Chaetomium globosum CBS 148.51]|uniref:Uncharacterized protein n=1 Tax=Chaetomium globosum (strain ATCC 6205 / CBS 148.51 / DSM 1962 / NBRC 6347 / NRRL 1970) TaxID=306901 RepID=Q2H0U4_CHAGB|nr:uncharacterized protein CHGG_04602 [Chaetomium globosum CBS 148.51]EAQ87983.1 hypothetical protein CHGG_04602 [Chaetomium globosum CBS 148.51]
MAPDGELSRALNADNPLSSSPARHPSISLQAAATLNAGLQRESPTRGSPNSPLSPRNQSPSTGRRRSQVLMNLQMANPSMPAPGEMVSESPTNGYHNGIPGPVAASPRLIASRTPHHNRTPSLGELHQELENEQEFQVNRLLTQIRQLQEQVQRQQQQAGVAGDEASERSAPGPAPVAVPVPNMTSSPQPMFPSSGSLPRSPVFPRSSFDMARADLRHRSRTPSRNASPRLRSTSISADSGEPWTLAGRDESAFYQAESQMLIRENQMLRHRIREMERQLSELQGTNTSSLAHEPSQSSHLNHSVSASEEDAAKIASTAATQEQTVKGE